MENVPQQHAPGAQHQHHHGHHNHPEKHLQVDIVAHQVAGNPDQVIVSRSKLTTGLVVDTTPMSKAVYEQIQAIAEQLAAVAPGAAIKNAATDALIDLATAQSAVLPEQVNREALTAVAQGQGAGQGKYDQLKHAFTEAAKKPLQLAVPSQVAAPAAVPGVSRVDAANFVGHKAPSQGVFLSA